MQLSTIHSQVTSSPTNLGKLRFLPKSTSSHHIPVGPQIKAAAGPCPHPRPLASSILHIQQPFMQHIKMISLDSLPVDIQYNILTWLICPLVGHQIARNPQNNKELAEAQFNHLTIPKYAGSNKFTGNHPYLCLAATNRTLRASIEDYCHHLVNKRLATCIKAKKIVVPKFTDWSADVAKATAKGKEIPAANLRTYRLQYLRWTYENCLFCGKKSSRRAIFNLQMWCCKSCDEKEWGTKVVSLLPPQVVYEKC